MFVQSETQQILHVSKKEIPQVFLSGFLWLYLNWYMLKSMNQKTISVGIKDWSIGIHPRVIRFRF